MAGYTNFSGTFLSQSGAYTTTIWANGTATITAGNTATRLMANGQGNVLVGGSYDDTLGLNSLKDKFTGGAGVDTVISTVDTILCNDIENLTMDATWTPVFGVANNGANIVKAATANVTLDAMGGDDVILSFGKKDTFLFEQGSGKDIIYNFRTGATDSDVVRLTGYGFDSFSEVTGAMTQTGTDVVLTLSPSDLILFKNTTISAFTAQNFQLSIDPSKLKLTFAEEFDSLSLQNKSAGGGIWATSFAWDRYTTMSAHNITSEQEVYVDPQFTGTGTTALGLNPFSIDDGVLTITAAPTPDALKSQLWDLEYTSGLLTTKGTFAQQYGYFEMRADLPDAKGAFPAFWLLPADGTFTAELDVMEAVGETNTVHNTVHYGPDGAHWTAPSFKTFVAGLGEGFHTYGLLWTAETLTWYVDGTQVAQIATPAEAKKPMYMLVNYAVGGNWAGDIAPGTTLPGMTVDYIRAYSLDAAPLASPTQGTAGNDTLTGTAGSDILTGGAGNDVFTVGIADTVVETADGGVDTVKTSLSYSLTDYVENLTLTGTSAINGTGNSLNNVITGNSAANVLTGGGGVDTFAGGAGNDTFMLNSGADTVVENASSGVDTVVVGDSYTLGANLENLTLTGSADIFGTGNAIGNYLTGNGGANTLSGLAGNDTLNGGLGTDQLVGGTGNDTFVVADADVIVEAAGEGLDVVNASISFTLGANVENLTLTGSGAISGTGNELANLLTGNGAANTLTGGDGADTLNGGAGADRLVGGLGDDFYVLGSDQDVVVEVAGQGIDTVTSNLNYSLGVTVENLTITGTYASYGYGNDLANAITGNGAANRLEGRGGSDVLIGGGGVDTLLGGVGNDNLTGGTGNDVFLFNKGDGDDVIADFGNGADILDLSSLLNAGYTATLVDSGSDTLVQLSSGDDILVLGVASSHLSATTSGFVFV
ncbi:family 16 glycosylhydrolase [Phenylobacterium sp. LjRoot225]|uniref:family 16 glycosylhydrolase n=1 Tax=Phenylobacterium sp. LjRoot225 TaxID=3342285 RepID=UPI003ECE5544